ncbi:helix-turn-helix domain-containing protein [Parabacteroides sp. W1-Q-101]|uniref:AraC family transcriptional regulator n=1 Tax=Parabacteroides caeci TaxID=2949650 RepID=UPI002030FA69|nr:helix-turn-helix domain-containing protein [Parabacteroides sp. W1-Q-101]MCM0721438.1 helix-turn-helix domain-containing protein [Parabacteroides sp. W1-Q-101]
MEPSIYSYSLCIALPLMLFFGFYFLLAQTPEKAIFENYLRSRRIMGMALLLLAANYSVHFFFGIRFKNVHAAILMNLSTYFLCYYLFSSALITLLDRFYITRKRIRTHIILWIIFSGLSGVVLLLFPDGIVQKSTLLALAAWLVVYGLVLSRRVIVAYRRAVRIFDDTHADDIGAYIKWLSIFTYWALIFGVGCGLLTFLPDEYVYIWILSSIPFYVYLYHCYRNYLLFYEQVETAMEDGMISEEEDPCDTKLEQIQKLENPSYRSEMAEKINGWIDAEGYIQSGLTIKKLADMLQTNRTYLSEYIKTTYGASFRDWITGLRINYAKRLLAQYPRLTVADISERSGFLSPSHFIRLFKENSGCTPVKWRKTEAE